MSSHEWKNEVIHKPIILRGARQVGKTTLSLSIGEKFYPERYAYLNWDNRDDRKNILKSTFRADKDLIIFDEIHKYKSWKNYLKGEYDKYKDYLDVISK